MPQIEKPQPPDEFALPFGITPQVQSTQPPNAPYYGFQPPPPLPSISSYQPTLGTQLMEQMWRAATGNFPGAEAVPQAGTTIFPHYSKLEEAILSRMPKQAPAEQVRGIIGKGGVKPEEVEYSGVEQYLQQAPLADREKLLAHIKQTRPQLETSQRGGYENPERLAEIKRILASDQRLTDQEAIALNVERQQLEEGRENLQPKFSQYTLPGGERYREILVKMPLRTPDEALSAPAVRGGINPASQDFVSSHFDEPNVLAHLRVNDRVTPDGKQVLFVEEVQSDWHQRGRQYGYKKSGQRSLEQIDRDLNNLYQEVQNKPATDYTKDPRYVALWQEREKVLEQPGSLGVPDAPYKKSWPLLAMKQALAEAAKEGKDYVAWTTGAQQAERYDLSKQVSKVIYLPEHKALLAYDLNGGQVINEHDVLPEKISDYIGKEPADRLLKSRKYGGGDGGAVEQSIEGVDLKVGGEGMASFYDKELVNELNKYAKQWGVKVEQIGVDYSGRKGAMQAPVGYKGAQDKVWALPITPRMREDILGKGQPLFSLGAGLAGGALAEKLAQPREQTLEQRETGYHLTRMGKDES